ncbi:diaminopropionate ammonia-lyase [Gillisia sp. Q332]|uniref:diaminopropionate ammonia-lyase n=1 Tax=Gillisia xinjiangensis TaxID=3384765 RepID=UPI00391AF60A
MKHTPYYLNKPDNILPKGLTNSVFRSSDPLAYHQSLKNYTVTPLLKLNELAKYFGVKKIFVKDESYRFGLNAFKGLGASFAISKILEKDPDIETFCSATDGNHGRAVAWSAKLFGKKSRIFVPKDTTRARILAIENEGAVVEKVDADYDETCEFAKEMSRKNGWQLVQDTASAHYAEIPAYIMAGYFTHFMELEDSIHTLPKPKIDIVFLQAGVGSWPAAAAWYYLNRYGVNRPKIVLVEPIEAAGILASFKKGKRTKPEGNFKTIMAGLNCGIPSLTAWDILKDSTDAAMAIEDSFTKQAIRELYYPTGDDKRIISGESGAGGLAGFIALMTDPRFRNLKEALNITAESRVLFYSTEGDTDPENFKNIIRKKK